MPATQIDSVAAFLQALRRSQLLDPSQINEIKLKLLAETAEACDLADRLIERGWLTDFQAEQLLEGHDQELVLGPYRLLELVGEGGLCQVYRAYDMSRRATVALKVMHPELRTNADVLAQFRQEMVVLSRMEHPNYVKAFEGNWDGQRYYFAMEFVDGIDLHRLLKTAGPLPVAQACDWIRQTALGVQYAYEQGIVHRDIKPANLLVPYSAGQVRILDIGLVRLEWANQETSPTPTSTTSSPSLTAVMGTPDYIAPEQALNSGQADIRSDIYSLGCTFYHLLTGKPPFPTRSLTRKLLDHQQTPAPSVRDTRQDVPPALAAILLKMMAKVPAERYQTPAGVAVTLASFCKSAEPRLNLEQFRPRPAARTQPERSRPAPVKPRAVEQPTASGPGTPGYSERRQSVRRGGNPVSVLISDAHATREPLSGWVLNRSSGGLGILVEEALEVGTLMSVRPTAEPSAQWFQVRVMHCTPHRSSWCVGLQFVQKPSWGDLRLFG